MVMVREDNSDLRLPLVMLNWRLILLEPWQPFLLRRGKKKLNKSPAIPAGLFHYRITSWRLVRAVLFSCCGISVIGGRLHPLRVHTYAFFVGYAVLRGGIAALGAGERIDTGFVCHGLHVL